MLVGAMVRSPLGRAGVRLAIPPVAEIGAASLEMNETGLKNIVDLREPLEEGYKLLVVFNHQSLGDIAPIVYVARAIRRMHSEHIKSFELVVAKSLQYGMQQKISDVLYTDGARPWFERQGIRAIDVVTDNDEKKRHIKKSSDSLKVLLRTLPYTSIGLILLPEGNLDGGRRDKQGELNGIGEIGERSAFFSYIVRREKKVVFLPVGINGLFEVLDPDTGNFTWHGGRAIALNYFRSNKEKLGEVHVGEPFTASELKGAENPGREVMRRISLLVPEEARGMFRQDRFASSQM